MELEDAGPIGAEVISEFHAESGWGAPIPFNWHRLCFELDMSLTRFSVPPLYRVTRHLAAVARGALEPDLVIHDVSVLSTYTERVLPGREVWVKNGRIAAVKDSGTAAKARYACKFFDGKGGWLAPGLIDPHVHIESSMMTACAYAEGALLNGVTTLFCDSHEIGNVCDAKGIEWMLEDARKAPLSIFLTIPSTVPATKSRFETAGGDLTAAKIDRLFARWPEAVALGEKMDYVQVASGDARSHAILAAALKRGRPVCGHIYGREFVAPGAASGITDTHESVDRQMAEDFLENGMWIFLRGGPPTTPWHSLPLAIKAVTELGASSKRVCVCTDDRDADDLFIFGLDWVVRQAVVAGVSPQVAWSMGSLHPATRYGFDGEMGGIAPARRADLVLTNESLEPQSTWYGGQLVVKDRKITPLLDEALSRRYKYPRSAYRTVNLPKRCVLTPPLPVSLVGANVIRVELPGILTRHVTLEFGPTDSWSGLLSKHDICFVSVVERHGKSGRVGWGLLQNFGLTGGAVASTVGHDAHNLIVAGTAEEDMALAVKTLAKSHGGVCVVRAGEVLAHVELPIAGLLSDLRATEVAEATAKLKAAWVKLGCTLPYMGFNLLPLSVIPELRLTDRGLVKVPEMKILSLMRPLEDS